MTQSSFLIINPVTALFDVAGQFEFNTLHMLDNEAREIEDIVALLD
jgi:hypothetical protein